MRARSIILSGAGVGAIVALIVALRAPAPRATARVVAYPLASPDDIVAPRMPNAPPVRAPEKVAVSTTTTTDVVLTQELIARLDGIETAVRDGDLKALPALAASDLAKEPEAAPAIIHALASLAVQGGRAEQELAGKTLARWLREESRRDTRDASGNVANLVEALGDLGGDAAVTALMDALDDKDGRLDLALQTTAVQRLGALGDRRAAATVERFAARLEKQPPSEDAFERELQNEAAAAAVVAREQLGR